MPRQIVADGDYTNHTSVKAAETAGVDFYGSWQETWKPTEYDAHGRGPAFMASAFTYHAEQDIYICPAGEKLTHHAIYNDKNGVRRHVYKQPRSACRTCPLRDQCASKKPSDVWRRSITRMEEPPATTAFKVKMETEEAKQIYKQRSQIAEFPHAWIKQRCGLRQFRCRGRWKASMEATWACLSYNITRWFSIRRKLNAGKVRIFHSFQTGLELFKSTIPVWRTYSHAAPDGGTYRKTFRQFPFKGKPTRFVVYLPREDPANLLNECIGLK
jgi:hypothetical protein